MQKLSRPWLLAVVLVVVAAGTFVGLAAAHTGEGDNAHEECEMQHTAEDCPMNGGMMGGMMQMGDNCPQDSEERMMGMNGNSGHRHDDCPMYSE